MSSPRFVILWISIRILKLVFSFSEHDMLEKKFKLQHHCIWMFIPTLAIFETRNEKCSADVLTLFIKYDYSFFFQCNEKKSKNKNNEKSRKQLEKTRLTGSKYVLWVLRTLYYVISIFKLFCLFSVFLCFFPFLL